MSDSKSAGIPLVEQRRGEPLRESSRSSFIANHANGVDRNLESRLSSMCSDLNTGTDLGSLLQVSDLLRQTRLKKQTLASGKVNLLHFRLDSSDGDVVQAKPFVLRDGDRIDVTPVKAAISDGEVDGPAPLHWFHVDSYFDTDVLGEETVDRKALRQLGNVLNISESVIDETMNNYMQGRIAIENGPGCVGIAFVDLVRVYNAHEENDRFYHPAGAAHHAPTKGRLSTLVREEPLDSDDPSSIKTIRQQPIAIFFSSSCNACLTVRSAPKTNATGKEIQHWQGIVMQLEAKSSLLHKKMDAAYLLFLLIDEVVDSVEPLLNTYGDALEGLEFLFDQYEATVRRNLMSRKLQKDLWVIRRWGWSISTIAEDLREDPWDVFHPEQEKPFKMLESQCKEITEISKAFILKADNQEDFFSQTQETATNNLLFNLTMFTIVMVPPQFFTGVYGMNFDNMPDLHNKNAYYILWGCMCLWWAGWFFYFWVGKKFKSMKTVSY